MEVRLSRALGPVRVALSDVAARSDKRRLELYGDKVPCKAGCASCCSRLVTVTMAEAVILYEALLASGSWPAVRQESKDQFKLAREADPLAWFKLNRPCPVLDPERRTCKGHKSRPATCAAHFVTSDPSLCSPWSVARGRYESADMEDLVEKFHQRVAENVDGFGILSMELPMPVALLLAERISIRSGLELEQAVSLLFQEFA